MIDNNIPKGFNDVFVKLAGQDSTNKNHPIVKIVHEMFKRHLNKMLVVSKNMIENGIVVEKILAANDLFNGNIETLVNTFSETNDDYMRYISSNIEKKYNNNLGKYAISKIVVSRGRPKKKEIATNENESQKQSKAEEAKAKSAESKTVKKSNTKEIKEKAAVSAATQNNKDANQKTGKRGRPAKNNLENDVLKVKFEPKSKKETLSNIDKRELTFESNRLYMQEIVRVEDLDEAKLSAFLNDFPNAIDDCDFIFEVSKKVESVVKFLNRKHQKNQGLLLEIAKINPLTVKYMDENVIYSSIQSKEFADIYLLKVEEDIENLKDVPFDIFEEIAFQYYVTMQSFPNYLINNFEENKNIPHNKFNEFIDASDKRFKELMEEKSKEMNMYKNKEALNKYTSSITPELKF